MERVGKASVVLGFLLIARMALGGVVFAPPSVKEMPPPGESYAESSFGKPPAQVDLGVRSGYADEIEPVATRAPAGLEVTSNSGGEPNKDYKPPKDEPSMRAGEISRKGVQEVALIAGDLGFFPKTVFVSRDVPVRMFVTGASRNTLCIMMDSFQVRKQVRSQKIEEISFTPNTPGKYRFYCPVNGMEGTLVVKEFAAKAD